jgi:hypothetical protein
MGARLEYIVIPLAFGFGTTIVAMVGTNWGAKQYRRAREIAWTGAVSVATACATIGLIVAIFPTLWMELFTRDDEVICVGATYLRIVGPICGLYGLGMALYFATQGFGSVVWTVTANAVRLLANAACALVAIFWLDLGVIGFFVAVAMGFCAYAAFTVTVMLKAKKPDRSWHHKDAASSRAAELARDRGIGSRANSSWRQSVAATENRSLLPLLDLAAAIDDEGHFLAVFHRLDGRTFGGGFDFSNLRITRGFKLGYKLLLGQGMGRREDANHQQRVKDRLRDCSRRHDLCSLACANRENILRGFNAYSTQRFRSQGHAAPRPTRRPDRTLGRPHSKSGVGLPIGVGRGADFLTGARSSRGPSAAEPPFSVAARLWCLPPPASPPIGPL